MNLPNEIWSAILGALLGAWITYRFALKLADKQFEQLKEISKLEARRSAARDFVDAFAPELAALRSGADMVGDAMDLLRAAYNERHSRAVEVFMHYLPEAQRASFRKDWLRHCYGTGTNGEPNSPEDEEFGMPHDSLLYLHFSDEWREKDGPGSRSRARLSMERLLAYASDA
jgi:hypothetical protein